MSDARRKVRRIVPKPVRDAIRGRRGNEGPLEAIDAAVEEERTGRWTAAQALAGRYPSVAAPAGAREALARAEARVWSQNGEDGILAYLFSLTGARSRTFVEFGIGDGTECCAANLAISFGWSGLMMECDPVRVAAARRFYDSRPEVRSGAVRIAEALVGPDNIDALLRGNGMTGEIDLLSIDIDGNDFWVWKAISAVDARVVVIEYNASLGRERSIACAFDPAFDRLGKHPSGYYHGASLVAFARLGASKGYVLAGCDSIGINAFFVREADARGTITPLSAAEAYYPNQARIGFLGVEEQFAVVAHMPFVEV